MKNLYFTKAIKRFTMAFVFLFSILGTAQTTILQENFEGFSNGTIIPSANSDIGVWYSSATGLCDGKTFWGVYDTGSGVINNRGLKPSTANASCLVNPGNYNVGATISNLFAYTTIATSGYTNITLEFDWKCKGENSGTTAYDYGSVVYRVGTTGSWTQITTGGTSAGKYYNNVSTTAPHATITLPATVNNLAKIQFGFRWDNDATIGAAPSFSIDNIVVKGTASACAGTPSAGAAIVNPTSGEAGSTYVVSATGTSSGTGLTFQWQSNTNNAGWINVGSSTSAYAALNSQVAPAFGSTVQWRLQTKCTSSGASSTSTIATFTSTYCSSVPVNDGFNDGITNVTFNTINNNSSANSGNEYSDFTAISTNITQGVNYPLIVRVNTDGNYTQYQRAWIDWNHDGDFNDAGESYDLGIATNVANGLSSLCPFNITVPLTAIIGSTRMRVSSRSDFNGGYASPCYNQFYDGEVEDYSLNIIAAPVCETVTASASKNIICPGQSINLIATTIGTGYTFNWYTDWDAVTSSGTLVGTGSPLTITPTQSNAYR